MSEGLSARMEETGEGQEPVRIEEGKDNVGAEDSEQEDMKITNGKVADKAAPIPMDMQEGEGQQQEATPTSEQTEHSEKEGSSKDSVGDSSGGVSGNGVASAGVGGDSEEKAVPQSEEEVKLWTAVRDNPSDFTSWTSLLQIVEQKGALGPAREVFDAFLQLYPYCYGYWKKYADLEKRHNNERAREVFEEGVKAIPLSVDLWLHYAGFAVTCYKDTPQGEELIRSLYKRAVQSCGYDYRSAKIWDSFIDWEMSSGRLRHVMAVYDQLLAIPTQQLLQHFENFKKLLETTPTSQLLCEEEYRDVSSQAGNASQGEALLDGYIRKATLEGRTAVVERTKVELERRRHFEDAIKRPYFHVKPLERAQLKNWKEYLDFEISEGNSERIAVLFERCLIACALYEDFWSKYCKYAEVHFPDRASDIYRRACTIHLRQKPNIHMSWAAFEEKNGNVDTAREVLKNIDQLVPGLVMVRLRRISLEVRAGRFEQADALYQECLTQTMALEMRNFYAWRYARFAQKILGDSSKAVAVMTSAVEMDSSNSLLYLQLLDLHTSGPSPPDLPAAEALFRRVANSKTLSEDVKESFVLRRQQLLEEFGGNISDLLEATEECQRLKKLTKKRAASESDSDPAKRARVEPVAVATPTSTPTYVPEVMAAAPLPPDQQWAAYQQQQWGGYSYGHQGYNYPGYYPPYSYGPQPT